MPLWIERYLIPICGAIVFGLVILNPLKFDWQQRVALLIAISAFAYFLAHTVHKPKIADADIRVSTLEKQVKDLEDRQQESANEAAVFKQRQTEIRGHLSGLATEGIGLRDEWHLAINSGRTEIQQTQYVERTKKWHLKNLEYLNTIPRKEAYLARFRAGVRGLNSYPSGMFRSQTGLWDVLLSDLEKLNEFISDPDLGRD